MENIMARLRRMGGLFLIGFIVIIGLALGLLYLQQGAKQKEFEAQIANLSVIVSKPLPSAEKLQEEYEEVNRALAPLTIPAALDIIVGIAEKSGINVDPDAGKFNIPPPGLPTQKMMDEGNYQILSLTNIKVQGEYDSVMAFIADLNSGKTLPTMVLTKVDIIQIEVPYTGEEADRRTEYRNVVAAVTAMMADNNITEIPEPIKYIRAIATNYMGDDPATADIIEGFPDITTTAAEKGYTGTATPKDGYMLYLHDKINPDDTTVFAAVSYITMLQTEYYYTCETNGAVTQFDGPDVLTATRYFGSQETKTETIATISADIYTKPVESDQP